MDLTPNDKELLAHLDQAIESELKLLPASLENVPSYDRSGAFNFLNQLRSRRSDLLCGLTEIRLQTIRAAARLTQ